MCGPASFPTCASCARRSVISSTPHGLRQHRTLTEAEAARDTGGNVARHFHAMMAERYALPGELVVGTDSHTPHSGALGCVAFGVGTTDMANAFVTGAVRLTMPASLRVELAGTLPPGVTAKDIVLHLLALPAIRAGAGVGKVFEFTGEAVAALSIDERATLTNMTAELGGLTGIVAPDAETVRFLRERRGVDVALEPWMRSDPGAAYAATLRWTAAPCPRWWRLRAIRATACRCRRCRTVPASTSPMAAPAPPASAKTSIAITRCWPGRWRAACASRQASRCICNTAPPRCATTAWRAATTGRSRRWARASCSRPVALAPVRPGSSTDAGR